MSSYLLACFTCEMIWSKELTIFIFAVAGMTNRTAQVGDELVTAVEIAVVIVVTAIVEAVDEAAVALEAAVQAEAEATAQVEAEEDVAEAPPGDPTHKCQAMHAFALHVFSLEKMYTRFL